MFQSFRQQGQEFLTEFDGRAVGKVGENDVFQFVELVFDGGVDFIVAVAEEIAGRDARCILNRLQVNSCKSPFLIGTMK